MGMPNIPNISPQIELDRDDMINLLLASIALEELGLAHLTNTEAEKLQRVVLDRNATLANILLVNKTVERRLRNVIKKEMILQFKLEDIIDLIDITDDDDEV